MPPAWAIFAIGVVAGASLRLKGLAIPVLFELGWWLVRGTTGHFANHSGNGDNPAAEAIVGAALGTAIGMAGVVGGLAIRSALDRISAK